MAAPLAISLHCRTSSCLTHHLVCPPSIHYYYYFPERSCSSLHLLPLSFSFSLSLPLSLCSIIRVWDWISMQYCVKKSLAHGFYLALGTLGPTTLSLKPGPTPPRSHMGVRQNCYWVGLAHSMSFNVMHSSIHEWRDIGPHDATLYLICLCIVIVAWSWENRS